MSGKIRACFILAKLSCTKGPGLNQVQLKEKIDVWNLELVRHKY